MTHTTFPADARRAHAALVRPARKAAGMSMVALAEAAGIGRNTVTAIEAGRVVPHAAPLLRVLAVLGLEPPPPTIGPLTRALDAVLGLYPADVRAEVAADTVERLAAGLIPKEDQP